MKIIVYHGKNEVRYYNYSYDSFQRLFDYMESLGFYWDVETHPHTHMVDLYKLAKSGSSSAAKEFLELRSNEGYEYERISIETLS